MLIERVEQHRELLLVRRHAQLCLLPEPLRRILLSLSLVPLTEHLQRYTALPRLDVHFIENFITFDGPFGELFAFDLNFLHLSSLLNVCLLDKGLPHNFGSFPLRLLLADPLLVENKLFGVVTPRLEARLVEHLRQEEVHWQLFVHLEVEVFQGRPADFLKHFVAQRDLSDLVLRHEFLDCHDFIELKANSGDELGPHDSV